MYREHYRIPCASVRRGQHFLMFVQPAGKHYNNV